MKGAFLLVALLLSTPVLADSADASHGRPHTLLVCGEAVQDACRFVCSLVDYLPFRVVEAVIDCLPMA